MEEFFEILMSSWTINQADQLELSLVKMIENWDLDELETILTTSKGV
jgi:hypothetical protein